MDISEPLRSSQESTTQIQEDVKVETDASIESNPTAAFFISLRSRDEIVMDPEVVIAGNERKSSNVDDSTIAETIPAVTNTKVAILSAEEILQDVCKEEHDMTTNERETTTHEKQTSQIKTNETREDIEEVEEGAEGTGAEIILACEEVVVNDTVTTDEITSTVSEEVVSVEHETTKETIVVEDDKETVNEVTVTKETGIFAEPAVPKKISWFRRVLNGPEAVAVGSGAIVIGASAAAAASGAGHVATCADCYDVVEEDSDPFVLDKARSLSEGKKGGSVGISTSALTAAISASSM